MLMSFSVPVFAGMLFLDLMTKSGTFRFFALAALTLVLPVSGASAGSLGDNVRMLLLLVIRRRH